MGIELPNEDEVWLELRIEGFQIYSNASVRETVDVARNLESMRRAVAHATNMNVRTPLTTKIYVFRDSATFTPFRDAMFDHSQRMTGAFIAHVDGNYIAINTERGSDGIVFHELMHYFNNNTNPNLPLWLDEGLAEVYSTLRLNGELVTVGRPRRNHVRVLRTRLNLRLKDLFAFDRRSPEYRDGKGQNIFYAQSWALTHYLLFGHIDRKARTPKFMELLAEGMDPSTAVKEAYGISVDHLEAEVRSYIRAYRFLTESYRISDLRPREVGVPVEMSRSSTLYHLGDLLAHTAVRNHRDAEKFLFAALEADPLHSGANATLGYLRALHGRKAEADVFYRTALENAGDHFLPYLRAAENIMRSMSDLPPAERPAAARRARELFRQSIERNPEIPRSYGGLGATYLTDGDPAEGIPLIEKSFAMAPSRTSFGYNLALLYARNGELSRAKSVIAELRSRGGSEEYLVTADAALLQQGVERINDLLRRGSVEEARELALDLLDETSDEILRSRLDQHLAAIDRALEYRKSLALYNRAVVLVNQQNVLDARKVLDELIAGGGDPDLIASAVGLREKIAALVDQ